MITSSRAEAHTQRVNLSVEGSDVASLTFGSVASDGSVYSKQLPQGASSSTYSMTVTLTNTLPGCTIKSATITWTPYVDQSLQNGRWALGVSGTDDVQTLAAQPFQQPLPIPSGGLPTGASTQRRILYYGLIADNSGAPTTNAAGAWSLTPTLSVEIVPTVSPVVSTPTTVSGSVK